MGQKKQYPIPRFTRGTWESGEVISRIGRGEIGGKGAGLVLLQNEFLTELDRTEFPEFEVTIPRVVVVCTDIFESFMDLNDLWEVARAGDSDDRIADAFLRATLPPEVVGDLRDFISQVHTPLAIRSSSLLEDNLDHPFAGVYSTKMIPNNQPDADRRYRSLDEAIRFVFATTFFATARDYFRGTGLDHSAERMAVLIQEVVGTRHEDRFYPEFSGVCRSFNYYPNGATKPTDGVVNLALGLGRQIVDGGVSWGYCPAYPTSPPPFNDISDRMYNTQTSFWGVNMGTPPLPDPMGETEYLKKWEISDAEDDGNLDRSASTYDGQSDRLRLGLVGRGPRVLDYGPVLIGGVSPLNDLLSKAIPLAERTLGCPVELEFAMDRDPDGVDRFCLLQIRPMAIPSGESKVSLVELNQPDLVLASERALGHGTRSDIRDIVYIKPESFDYAHSRQVAYEVENLNNKLQGQGCPYMLIGFGRWGSSDPWLGVPVNWGQLSGARIIVEASFGDTSPDPSQGAHFFHNLIAFDVFYMTVRGRGVSRVNWAWLQEQESVSEGKYLRHVRLENPMSARVDGLAGLGLIEAGEGA